MSPPIVNLVYGLLLLAGVASSYLDKGKPRTYPTSLRFLLCATHRTGLELSGI